MQGLHFFYTDNDNEPKSSSCWLHKLFSEETRRVTYLAGNNVLLAEWQLPSHPFLSLSLYQLQPILWSYD